MRFCSRPMANIAKISYSKKLVRDYCAGVHHFSKHPSPSEHRICAKRVQWCNGAFAYRGDYAVFVDVIESPRCSKCGELMALRIIEPERSGFDLRTFECPKCLGTQSLVASISCEVDVSIVPARSRR